MIDIDEYIEMWDDNLLGSEGVQILMNTLIAEVKRLLEVNDELQGDLEQFIERSAEDEAGLKDELEATEAEVKRLRERLIRAYDWAENAVNGNDSAMMDYTEYVCGDEGD